MSNVVLACLLAGCGNKSTLYDVLQGRMKVDTSEREALARLAAAIDAAPEAIPVWTDKSPRGANSIRIENGSVVEVELMGLSDPSPLAEFTRLKRVSLRQSTFAAMNDYRLGNAVSSWTLDQGNLTECRGLTAASLDQLTLSGVPLEVFEGLDAPKLTYLSLADTDLSDLSRLGSLPELEQLHVTGSSLHGYPEPSHLPNLKRLSIDVGAMEHLGNIPQYPGVEHLRLYGMSRQNLEGMPAMAGLRSLRIHGQGLTSIKGLPALPNLETLDLSGHQLRNLDGLPELPRLRSLDLSRNPIAFVDGLENQPALKEVDISHTEVTRLPASLRERGVGFEMNPEMDAMIWEQTLRSVYETNFVETLPASRGTIRDRKGRIASRVGTFQAPSFSGTLRLGEVEGLARLRVLEVDLVSPAQGGTESFDGAFRVHAAKGAVRIYTKVDVDPKRLAQTLAGAPKEKGPLVSVTTENPDAIRGYSFSDVPEGETVTHRGKLAVLGTEAVLWLEAVDGTAHEVTLEFSSTGTFEE